MCITEKSYTIVYWHKKNLKITKIWKTFPYFVLFLDYLNNLLNY